MFSCGLGSFFALSLPCFFLCRSLSLSLSPVQVQVDWLSQVSIIWDERPSVKLMTSGQCSNCFTVQQGEGGYIREMPVHGRQPAFVWTWDVFVCCPCISFSIYLFCFVFFSELNLLHFCYVYHVEVAFLNFPIVPHLRVFESIKTLFRTGLNWMEEQG